MMFESEHAVAVDAYHPQPETEQLLLIGEAAKRVGLEPKTIRFYDRSGLIEPRRLGQIRVFNASDIENLKLIACLRQMDVSIPEMRTILQSLSLSAKHDRASAQSRVQELLAQHLSRMESRFHEMQRLVGSMKQSAQSIQTSALQPHSSLKTVTP
jgi:MerR family transcriptional regulator, copper efflux regulator